MAKPRHLTGAANKSNRGRQLRPRQRVDVAKLPKSERMRLTEYASTIKGLVDQELASGTPLSDDEVAPVVDELDQTLRQVRDAMGQYQRYHEAYPGQHPANAFTPLLGAQNRAKGRVVRDDIETTDLPKQPRLPRKGIPIALVSEPLRSEIEKFADKIKELVDLQDDLGRLPDGMLGEVAREIGCTTDWVVKRMKVQREYCAAYPDEPPANAHTPRPVGRPKGRTSPQEVIQTIELARINKKWLSRNGEGGYDEINNLIEKRPIHSLVEETYGKVHSERTTYRIIDDYEERRRARVAVAEDGPGVLQNLLPAIGNKARGAGDRAQFDIRPLPVVVDNDGVLCTVHVMVTADDAGGFIPSWEAIPGKRIDNDGEVHSQTFKDQKARATVALATLRTGCRFREYYADHGFEALQKYMQFMVAPGEDPTILIHRRRGRPRGGGGIEVILKLIDGFLRYRSYYVSERDFRRSRQKKKSEIRTFAQFKADFKEYIHHWNHDPAPDGGPSRYEVWKGGPDYSLSPPKPENLALFAAGQRREKRKPRRDSDCWFWLDSTKYVAYRTDPAIYEQFAAAILADRELDIIVFEFGDEPEDTLVLFSLDGEETWELAVPEGTRELSGRRQTATMQELERSLEHGDDEKLDKFFHKVILGSVNGPLVIDGLRRKRVFYPHGTEENTTQELTVADNLQRASDQEGSVTTPAPDASGATLQEPPPDTPPKPDRQPKPRPTGGKRASASATAPQAPAPPPDNASTAPVAPPALARPLVPNFIARLKQRAEPDEPKE